MKLPTPFRSRLLAVAASAPLLGFAGCAAPMRSVTHISSWSTPNGDYFYLAYAEIDQISRLKLCRIKDDNTVTCVDQPEVDRLLNGQ